MNKLFTFDKPYHQKKTECTTGSRAAYSFTGQVSLTYFLIFRSSMPLCNVAHTLMIRLN